MEPGRADLPVRRRYTSASFDAALNAAQPANRKRSLHDLDANLFARSSTRPMERRVKAWQRLCEAWDVKPWPITFDAIKKVCASLSQGGYTSVEGYLQAALWYQDKEFGIDRRAARRLAKAATRGLVAGRVKESFDVDALAALVVDIDHYMDGFDITDASHVADVLIVACWLRWQVPGLRTSSSRTTQYPYFSRSTRSHRGRGQAELTLRTLQCACGAAVRDARWTDLAAFWNMDPPPCQETPERQAQAWRHVGRNVTGNVQQHLIANGLDSVARLGSTDQRLHQVRR